MKNSYMIKRNNWKYVSDYEFQHINGTKIHMNGIVRFTNGKTINVFDTERKMDVQELYSKYSSKFVAIMIYVENYLLTEL